ncbi:polyprotein [Panicum miliaceum]|uniref:Polyprotein n=1 Tax=Panicum miliaceum TaxID=4540 RepID=A0A3L6QYW8_PANMI|nr:polyprotein [Panicum miliaceum]
MALVILELLVMAEPKVMALVILEPLVMHLVVVVTVGPVLNALVLPPALVVVELARYGLEQPMFIPDFSRIAKPMTELLKKEVKFVWNEKCEEAFHTLREHLTTAPVLAQPDNTKSFDVYCDASVLV